jgi:hypothetical protein
MHEIIIPTILLIMSHILAECAENIGRCMDIFLHIITFTRAMSSSTYLAPRYNSLLQRTRCFRGQIFMKYGTMTLVMDL